jgi:threonine dehydrogenase-like Zn-dependent dehydrogenase
VSLDFAHHFWTNVTITGGVSPARAYISELLPHVLSQKIDPGKLFTSVLPMNEVARAYQLMDSRETIKACLLP